MENRPVAMPFHSSPIVSAQSHRGSHFGDSGIESPPSRLMPANNSDYMGYDGGLMDSLNCSPIPFSPNVSASESGGSSIDSFNQEHAGELPGESMPPSARMDQLDLLDDNSGCHMTSNLSMSPIYSSRGLGIRQRQDCEESMLSFKMRTRRFRLRPCPANFNPFTPEGAATKMAILNGTQKNTGFRKRVSVNDVTTVRYNQEFDQLEVLGYGYYGQVYKVKHRLDGMFYAVKCCNRHMSREPTESALREIYAQSVIGGHPNIVRFFSAWIENRFLYIQTEYCDGGSLATVIARKREANSCMDEKELRLILKHIAQGLKFMHAMELVHLDIKPSNILMCVDRKLIASAAVVFSDLLLDDVDQVAPKVIYKIADFGMVSTPKFHHGEDGDCRYMAPEQFNDSVQDLYKADIFSLAMTIFDVGSVEPVPNKSDCWKATKIDKWNQEVSGFWDRSSKCFRKLLRLMIAANPLERISAAQILQHAYFVDGKTKLKQELENSIAAEKATGAILAKLVLTLNKLKERSNDNYYY